MSLARFKVGLSQLGSDRRVGHVLSLTPSSIVADGPQAPPGALCEIEAKRVNRSHLAEIVSVAEDRVTLVPLDSEISVLPGARVTVREIGGRARTGDGFKGRAIDAVGDPIDGKPPILAASYKPLNGDPIDPLDRVDPTGPLVTGVRAVDAMLTLGRGQRIGIFAAAGVGKTTLLRQIARQSACDRLVVCLVGERGREVANYWQELSKSEAIDKATLVAATSETSPVLRARAVQQALCLAEQARDQGEHVLLVIDSVTRFAMALREIGLMAGAPPSLRAYTPNVFSALPRLVERCGALRHGGAITAVMTVLSETDDVDDPITETMKSLLDGHIVMSRQIAERGQFPAIDIPASISRLASSICSPTQLSCARAVLHDLALFEDSRTMVDSGLYKPGANAKLDEALRRRPDILSFLQQTEHEQVSFEATLQALTRLAPRGGSHDQT